MTGAPEGYGTVTPWLISRDSAALIRFLEAGFGAEEIPGSRVHNPDGSIGHVEVRIGSSVVMLFDSYHGWPETPGFFRLYVDDADVAHAQAIAAGANSITEVTSSSGAIESVERAIPSGTSGGSRAAQSMCLRNRCRSGWRTRPWSRRCATSSRPWSTRSDEPAAGS